MISALRIKNFKSLQDVSLSLGNLNLLLGTNSSGKSNFLDALRFLQGVGNGFTFQEILNGKPKTATSEVWDGIRGGSEYAAFRPNSPGVRDDLYFEVRIQSEKVPFGRIHYGLRVSAAQGRSLQEWLYITSYRDVFDSTEAQNDSVSPSLNVKYFRGTKGRQPHFAFERSRPVLHQLAQHPECTADDKRLLLSCIDALSDMQKLDPSPEILRNYSSAQFAPRMGERGENFAALINQVCQDEKSKAGLLGWLSELSPTEIEDVVVLRGALREPLFAIIEKGQAFPAPILSDGTLRFTAIAAAFFQASMPEVLTIEEIEKGIHPSRLRLLLELLRSQTKRLQKQVVATTHSPNVVAWLNPEDLETTFIFARDIGTGASAIIPLSRIPRIKELLDKGRHLEELFAEGWLETIVA